MSIKFFSFIKKMVDYCVSLTVQLVLLISGIAFSEEEL